MRKIFGFFLLSLIFSTAYASYPQEVYYCLTVTNNTSPFSFEGRFYSSDLFDHGSYIHALFNGTQCISHRYKHGPKNIALSVKVNGPLDQVLIVPGASCGFMYNYKRNPGWLTSDYQGTGTPTVSWAMTLMQGPPLGMYRYVYYMECKRFAEPQMG